MKDNSTTEIKDESMFNIGIKEVIIIGELVSSAVQSFRSGNLHKWFKDLKAMKLIVHDRLDLDLRNELRLKEKKINYCMKCLNNEDDDSDRRRAYHKVRVKMSELIEDYDYTMKTILADQGYKMPNKESSLNLFGQDLGGID